MSAVRSGSLSFLWFSLFDKEPSTRENSENHCERSRVKSGHTAVESAQKVITRSKAKQDNQLAKIVNQNRIDSLKLKRSGKINENLVDNKYKFISNLFPAEQELGDTLQLDDSSLAKTLFNDRSILNENSGKTLTDELSYFGGSNFLSSTVITIGNKTEKSICHCENRIPVAGRIR